MCLAQEPQRSDAVEARTRGLSVSSQALYHWAKVNLWASFEQIYLVLCTKVQGHFLFVFREADLFSSLLNALKLNISCLFWKQIWQSVDICNFTAVIVLKYKGILSLDWIVNRVFINFALSLYNMSFCTCP